MVQQALAGRILLVWHFDLDGSDCVAFEPLKRKVMTSGVKYLGAES